MANAWEIPGNVVPDISSGASMLLGVFQANKAHELARKNAETQAKYAENSLKRLSAQEARDKAKFEQDEKDRRYKAVQSANELRRQGRHSEADMLLKLHGVQATPVMGETKITAPEVVMPTSAAANAVEPEPGQPGSQYEVPLSPELAHAYVTPMQAAASVMPPRQEHGVGITVPEELPAPYRPMTPNGYRPGAGMGGFDDEARRVSADNLTSVGTGLRGPMAEEDPLAMGPPSAERDLMPITLPGKTTPGAATGAYSYKGPNGEDFGTFDPAQEQAFRAERAARVEGALGPMGEKVTKIANLLASGDIDQKEAGALLTMLRTEESNTSRANLQEDKQAHEALMNKLYKNEPLTVQDRKDLARIMAGGRVAAAAAGNAYKQEGANDRLFSLLDRRARLVQESGAYKKLVANDKTVRGVIANLNSNLPLAHADAQVSLARIFRQAQPTEGEMHLLYDKLGGWTDKFEQFKAKVRNGDLSPEQMRQLRGAAKIVQREHQEDIKRFMNVARSGLGPKSGLDEIPDQAQKAFEMMAAELGYESGELPPLYETEGGVTLGTKQAPSTRPRTKKGELDSLESEVSGL